MFRYRRDGSKSYWVVIFWIPQGALTSSTELIKNIAVVSREALAHLLRRQTADDIASICYTVGSNSIFASVLLSTLFADGTSPIFCDTKSKNEFVQEISNHIQKSDSINKDEYFPRTCRSFTVAGIQKKVNFLSSG